MSNLIDITPPESFHKAPLTPPPTDEETPSKQVLNIIQCLELQLAGQRPLSSPGKVFHLAHRDFDHLLKTLELDQPLWRYFQTKVRYDYSSRAEQFVLRMPSTPHEFCVSSIVSEIDSQLGQHRTVENSANRVFSTNIQPSGSVDLELLPDDDGNINKHTPDGSFWHSQAKWPGVVIEVAFSQSLKKLDRVAWDYIGGSNGGIQVVIGLNLAYKGKGASVFVWRVRITTGEDGIDDFDCVRTVAQEIVNSDGKPSAVDTEQGLSLQLRDFAAINSVLSDSTTFSEHIIISYKKLGEIVLTAWKNAEEIQTNVREERVLKPSTRKRKRESTPGGELVLDDEEKRKMREDWEQERLEEKDPDYTGT